MAKRRRRVPIFTLAFVCAALLVSAGPAPLREQLAFERSAVVAGEWWRVWTGHLVHWEPSLAVWDLGALALLGGWVESRSRAELLAVLGLGAFVSGVAVLVLRPDLASYQGSSALASALFVNACLRLLARANDPYARATAAFGLLGLAAKVGLESAGISPTGIPGALESVAVAHLAGALAGGVVRYAFELAAPGRERALA